MASQLRRSSSLFLHQIKYLIAISLFLLSAPAFAADKPYCRWGDCDDGIGEKVYPRDSGKDVSYISKFRDGKRQGYVIQMEQGSSWICEQSWTSKGNRLGIQFCATKKGSRTYRYLDPKGTVKGSDYIWVSNTGKVSVGRWFSSDNVWAIPVDLDKIYRDHRALKNRGRDLIQFLPTWFPDRIKDEQFLTEKEMMAVIEKNKEAELKNKDSQLSKDGKSVDTTGLQTGCFFGDCKNGFGTYRWKSGSQHAGYWQNSKQHGYGAYISSSGRECDGNYETGKRKGLSVCLKDSMASANYYLAGKRTGSGIEWNPKTGEILKLGRWRSGKFVSEERVDLKRINDDWMALRGALSDGMRSLFFGEEFRALALPEDDQSDWLRERELVRASRSQVIPKEAPIKLGCISGNCEDGFGEFATTEATFASTFRNRRFSGYTLVTSSQQQCETRMTNGFNSGMEHCVDIQSGNHTFAYRWKAGLKGAKITVSQVGDLLDYRVYESDEEVSISFSSEAERQELAAVELENFLFELQKFKKKAPREARVLRVAWLEKVPPIRFGSYAENDYAESVQQKPKVVADPKPTARPAPPVTSKPKPKADKPPATVVSPARPEERADVRKAVKPTSDLQRLAYIAAELNSNRRQINYNYRLDKVRIDPNKFELVYEFTAMTPIRKLDTSVITKANRNAYCTSSKLKPFRNENMPARWSYVDAEDQTFEVLTGISDCYKP